MPSRKDKLCKREIKIQTKIHINYSNLYQIFQIKLRNTYLKGQSFEHFFWNVIPNQVTKRYNFTNIEQ